MGEATDPKDAQADPAAALGRMAEARPDPAEALAAGPPAGDADEGAEPPAGGADEGIGTLDVAAAAEAEAAPPGRTPPTRAAGPAPGVGHAYKKTMIPLMLVVAGLLVMVGIAGTVMLVSGSSARGQARHGGISLVTLVSFPLAAVLLLGAWLFHRDVRDR